MRKDRDTHLWRSKKNGKLYKLYHHVRTMYLGATFSAEPYMHDTQLSQRPGAIHPRDFEKAYMRNDG